MPTTDSYVIIGGSVCHPSEYQLNQEKWIVRTIPKSNINPTPWNLCNRGILGRVVQCHTEPKGPVSWTWPCWVPLSIRKSNETSSWVYPNQNWVCVKFGFVNICSYLISTLINMTSTPTWVYPNPTWVCVQFGFVNICSYLIPTWVCLTPTHPKSTPTQPESVVNFGL